MARFYWFCLTFALQDEGKWLSWDVFLQAIDELQREFDAIHGEPNPEAARMLHDLCLLRREALPLSIRVVTNIHFQYMQLARPAAGRSAILSIFPLRPSTR